MNYISVYFNEYQESGKQNAARLEDWIDSSNTKKKEHGKLLEL